MRAERGKAWGEESIAEAGSMSRLWDVTNPLERPMKAIPVLIILALLAGCEGDAQIASRNLSKAADMFEINRRVVFYNGITGEYMLSIEGLCSLGSGTETRSVTVTCKTGPQAYKKHFLGISDNVTYFAEQLEPAGVSTFHYRVIFKPQSIVPNVDLEGSGSAMGEALTR